jgi:hypothetical protein
MANYFRLTIWYSKITGKNITRGPTSGSAAAKKTIIPTGVIVKTINHRQNAASCKPYLSSDGATIQLIDHHCPVNYDDSSTKYYRAIYAYAILYILAK